MKKPCENQNGQKSILQHSRGLKQTICIFNQSFLPQKKSQLFYCSICSYILNWATSILKHYATKSPKTKDT